MNDKNNKKRKLENVILLNEEFNIDNVNTIEEINNFLKIKREKIMNNLLEIDNLRNDIRKLDRKLDKLCNHEYEYTGESYRMYERPPKRCKKCKKER